MKYFIILFVVCLCGSALGQTSKPLKDLTIGNRFVYQINPVGDPRQPLRKDTLLRVYEDVLRDTIVNSQRYAVIFSSFDRSIRYERSNDTAVFLWRNGRDELFYSWNQRDGDSVTLDMFGLIFRQKVEQAKKILASDTNDSLMSYTLSNYNFEGKPGFVLVAFVQGWGRTQADIYGRIGRNDFGPLFDRQCKGAVIKGVVYRDTSTVSYITDVNGNQTPITTALTNIPNPFSESVNLEYSLGSAVQDVELRIYSSSGSLLASLRTGAQATGKHSIEWNGKAADGTDAPVGTYFVALLIEGRKQSETKVMRMK